MTVSYSKADHQAAVSKNVKIYPNIGKSASIARGPGFFGGAIVEKFPNLAIEDEKRLLNSRIREHFLTKLYTHASFRMVKKIKFNQRIDKISF